MMKLKEKLRSPVLSSLMGDRTAAGAICAVGALQAGLVLGGLPAWQCPMLATTGIPCPGCGLSRAVALFLRGEWPRAMETHAYAPVLIFTLSLLLLALVLPGELRRKLISAVEAVERRTAVSAALLIGIVIYWLARLLFHSASIAFAVPG
ncbi:MAG: DUF2752 domain-containing protein [Blastocatellia bacterium]